MEAVSGSKNQILHCAAAKAKPQLLQDDKRSGPPTPRRVRPPRFTI